MNKTEFRNNVKAVKEIAETLPRFIRILEELKAESGLSERAFIVLAADAAGLSRRMSEKFITGFGKMRELYLPPPETEGERKT